MSCSPCGVRPSPQSGPNKPHLGNNRFLSLYYDRSHVGNDAPHHASANSLTLFSGTRRDALISHKHPQSARICHPRMPVLRRPPLLHTTCTSNTPPRNDCAYSQQMKSSWVESSRLACGPAPVLPRTAAVLCNSTTSLPWVIPSQSLGPQRSR